MATKHNDTTKALRWNLRVSESEDAVVRAALELADESLTRFVREAAVNEAQRLLADRTRFELDAEAWARFTELLDRPAQVRPELVELFSRPRPE